MMATRERLRSRARFARFIAAAVAIALVVLAVGVFRSRRTSPPPPRMSVLHALGPRADDDRFARAVGPREFRFPEDHGPHPDFRTEWWYWTGNLDGPDGRRFGYQFTVFRSAIDPEPTRGRDTAWATSQVYMAHFALSDASTGRFYAFERTSRAALELAGASASPFRVWVLDWSAEGTDRPGVPFAPHLRASSDDVTIDLELSEGKPIVLHGDRGLSPKGREPGNASYYYSLTRMPTRGSVAVGGRRSEVRGESWMDREWSTSALEPDQVGWDWLALQLEDGRELMFFRLRRKDGSTDPMSGGTLVDRDGTSRRLRVGDFRLDPSRTWKSARSGAVYPVQMHLRVPAAEIDLRITAIVDDQELDVSFRYWEGAVRAEGRASGDAIRGRGYLELTGYGESPHERW
jgi:predicted secreted hydrolase